jgi:hypothetical protein
MGMKEFPVLAALRDVRAAEGASAVKACRRAVTHKLRKLPPPRDMIPAELMAARAILAHCRSCRGCERAL